MIQPYELKLNLPMRIANGVMSTTTNVWQMLVASRNGDQDVVKRLVDECPAPIYAQYNYTPPVYFAAREGHTSLMKYLLENGAHDPNYKTYPFQEKLQTIAGDRGYTEIVSLLDDYAENTRAHKYKGDNGEIIYNRSEEEQAFEKAVDEGDLKLTEQILKAHPEFAKDQSYFWSEGILIFAVKENNRPMIDLLMDHGARVPAVLKWAQYYYLEHPEGAVYIMEKGMNPNTMSWHHVTILHDMAQKGNIDKARLLLAHGADINAVDEEYQSTPLGLAARWGQVEMVRYLIEQGADINKASMPWATPLSWAKRKGFPEIEQTLVTSGAV